ncbi:MAG: aminoglycoside 6-adenylyltransferase [Chloroflexi bacterium]|nr:aminoglycoside 6-adenylyltransferase [Chloroflexota bacterium]MCI0648118.1 aminoglycoside 6-adenylyltransferase [Chloroflexota bacterium]MCI0725460.1 aminoglycoside 6-adenylyltransferase [Chloroflexota bacterium]
MRSEQEMLELIIDTAKCDERIRAVIMNGSRANPNAPRDIFQDFDIVYLVTDVVPFKNNDEWIKRFGEIMIMQMPEAMQDPPPSHDGSYVYLMQFTDGNRIDLTIYPLAKLNELGRDSLSRLLLDKDGIMEPFAPASESDYLPKPPTAKLFSDCCNEFWWVCTYVAKGLWREEIIYAKYMLDQVVREQLIKMLTWHIGLKTQFSQNPGKLGKYFRRHLEPELWNLLQETYADASYENTWEALFTMCNLFRQVALPIAEHFGFDYPHGDDQRVSAHLEHVRFLPKNAKEIY